jgi:Flp pilus assembly protein TadG
MTGERPQEGQLLVLTLVLMTLFVVLAGLVVDGGAYLDAREQATDLTASASRAAAATMDPAALQIGRISLATSGSRTSVSVGQEFLARAGHPGRCTLLGASTVACTVTETVSTRLLGLIGVGSMSLTVTESATDIAGIPGGQP